MTFPPEKRPAPQIAPPPAAPVEPGVPALALPKEVGGRDGLDPTRFGDWEKAGRCIDF